MCPEGDRNKEVSEGRANTWLGGVLSNFGKSATGGTL